VRLGADQIGKRHGAVLALPARGQMGFAIAVGEFERVVKRVVIAAVDPADEQRALFERGVAGAEEIVLGHADAAQGLTHAGPGSLADAHRRHVGRFDQGHLQGRSGRGLMRCRDQRGGQPAGRAATDDHDLFQGLTTHASSIQ